MIGPGVPQRDGHRRRGAMVRRGIEGGVLMMGLRKTLWVSLLLATAAIVPRVAFAQTGSAIAGVVKDTTGAVTPGVTVEASSPSLIEKVRTAVTDGQGQYTI